MSNKKENIYPKIVVPSIPFNGGIKFLMDRNMIEIEGKQSELLWKILSECTGFNSVEAIARKTKIDYDIVKAIVEDLMGLKIAYDSRELFLHFHDLSKSPDLYPQNLSREDVVGLENQPRTFKVGEEFSFKIDETSELSKIIRDRHSCRSFSDEKLSKDEIGNLCHQAYSLKTHAVPSGGALYPLQLYIIVAKDQNELPAGYYQYNNVDDKLIRYSKDVDVEQLKYCFNDLSLPFNSAVQIVIAADIKKEPKKYSNRGYRLTLIEAGHVAQNICLYGEYAGIKTCELGGVLDDELAAELKMEEHVPLLSIAIGKPSEQDIDIDPISFVSELEKQYVGEGKPVSETSGAYFRENGSFFAGVSTSGDELTGGASSSYYMAKAKSIIEGVERYISENPKKYLISKASNLPGEYLDPRIFLNKEDSRLFTVDTDIAWAKGKYLKNDADVFVPLDLVYYGDHYAPNRICYSNSSGVAAYTDIDEAITRAIAELTERDALMRNWYARKPPTIIDVNSLPLHAKKRAEAWKRKGREMIVFDMESEYIPTIQTVIKGNDFPCFASGASSDFDVEKAIYKSIQEAEIPILSRGKNKCSEQHITPKEVMTPADHGLLYAQKDYSQKMEWMFSRNRVMKELPVAKYNLSEIIEKLNPIVVVMESKGLIKVVKVISEACLPITFGYNNVPLNHPVMKKVDVKEESIVMPHYFA